MRRWADRCDPSATPAIKQFRDYKMSRNETSFLTAVCLTWVGLKIQKIEFYVARMHINIFCLLYVPQKSSRITLKNYLFKTCTALMKCRPCYKPLSRYERGFD